ncbi:flavin monoamine oxidase family protein [Pseudorhodoplanes sp.]|uniref:flavin monoamine oxidase family protein n=1 Tax=Pseudorhodoplanes sp. TaxID=1934341 RepID=UPI003D0D9898
MPRDYDAIVIGGGFAGVTAARDLCDQGHGVLLLEARDRLGGRTWFKEFGDTGCSVEFGGTWIATAWQPQIAAEIERYGHDLILSPTGTEWKWAFGDTSYGGPLPIPVDEWLAFERALVAVDSASQRVRFGEAPLDQQDLADLDVSFSEWLGTLELPRRVSEFLLSWVSLYFGCAPGDVSTLHVLSWIAGFDNSAIAWYVALSEKFAAGTRGLVSDMFADAGADLALECPVTSIESHKEGVKLSTGTGDVFTASAVVLAAPINTWEDVEFRPSLGEPKARMAKEKQAGHSPKFWALVEDVPGYFYGMGYQTKAKWMQTEYRLTEGNLIVGFGDDAGVFDVTDGAQVEQAVREFIPNAKVIASEGHDWTKDRYSQGTWLAYRPGQVMRFASEMQKAEGRIFFAGSDTATGWAGWMEGAVESGHRAAAEVGALLASGENPRIGVLEK